MTDANDAIDTHLRAAFDEGTDGRHLTAWAVVGLYEDPADSETSFIAVAGSSNVATNIGLLRLGEAFLLEGD